MEKSPSSESELLEMISSILPPPSPDVLTGIGDDCAVIRHPLRKDLLQLLKTDALVGGIHFFPSTPLHLVGWKALCRPISDIAAMGGTPRHAMITVAAPSSWLQTDWKSLYKGIAKAARHFDISVVGGETVRSPEGVFLSVSLTGEVAKSRLKLRSGAKPGDFLCVTGKLGGSLKSGRHLNFVPRLQEGAWLGAQRAVTSMMDLSDGLGSDLPKLATESGCSYRITPDLLPLHNECTVGEAIADGEDYELLLTVRPAGWPLLLTRWDKAFPRTPLTCIGRMTAASESSTPLTGGYDHFKP